MESLNFNWAKPGAREIFWLYMDDEEEENGIDNGGDSDGGDGEVSDTSFDKLFVFRRSRLYKVGDPRAEAEEEVVEGDAKVHDVKKKPHLPRNLVIVCAVIIVLVILGGWAYYHFGLKNKF